MDGSWLRLHSDGGGYVTSPLKDRVSLDADFSEVAGGLSVPTVAHELGQWVVNPAYDTFEKFTGPIKPRNLEAFKEEVERALRTPDFGGFQLLQLQDFPGQGEALVGFLDSFWDSKGIFTPEEFRRFCSPTVPLLRMEKAVWTTGETFRATAQVHHYGRAALQGAEATWALRDQDGEELASRHVSARGVSLPRG